MFVFKIAFSHHISVSVQKISSARLQVR